MTNGMSKEEFGATCAYVWFDLIEAGHAIQLTEVRPQPETLLSSTLHIIVSQDLEPQDFGVLLRCEALPPFAKHRALIAPEDSTVFDIFYRAQVGNLCQDLHRPCYVDSPLFMGRTFYTLDRCPLVPGLLLQGDIMVGDPNNPAALDDDAADESADSDDEATTAILSPQSQLELDISSEAASDTSSWYGDRRWTDRNSASPSTSSSQLSWAELPIDYLVNDVFETLGTFDWEPQEDFDGISLMENGPDLETAQRGQRVIPLH